VEPLKAYLLTAEVLAEERGTAAWIELPDLPDLPDKARIRQSEKIVGPSAWTPIGLSFEAPDCQATTNCKLELRLQAEGSDQTCFVVKGVGARAVQRSRIGLSGLGESEMPHADANRRRMAA
jgi:hypothetical protein